MGFMFVKSRNIKEKKSKPGINFMGMWSTWRKINILTSTELKLNTQTVGVDSSRLFIGSFTFQYFC